MSFLWLLKVMLPMKAFSTDILLCIYLFVCGRWWMHTCCIVMVRGQPDKAGPLLLWGPRTQAQIVRQVLKQVSTSQQLNGFQQLKRDSTPTQTIKEKTICKV